MSISSIYRSTTAVVDPSVEKRQATAPHGDFAKILDEQSGSGSLANIVGRVQLSQHARARIESREILWNENIEERVAEGINVAGAKGSREALILADNLAVIANVRSRTVITAIDRAQMKGRIVTNIDSAVLV